MTRLLWIAALGAFLLGCSGETANEQGSPQKGETSKNGPAQPAPAEKQDLTLTYFTMQG